VHHTLSYPCVALTALPEATEVRKKSGEVDPRTSTEARELIAAEALKQAVPTKEMEVIEWEQALFRAAKRALQRSKVPSQRTQKLVKSLQRSSKFDPGMSALLITIAASRLKMLRAAVSAGTVQVQASPC
jgi:hypothetical protein